MLLLSAYRSTNRLSGRASILNASIRSRRHRSDAKTVSTAAATTEAAVGGKAEMLPNMKKAVKRYGGAAAVIFAMATPLMLLTSSIGNTNAQIEKYAGETNVQIEKLSGDLNQKFDELSSELKVSNIETNMNIQKLLTQASTQASQASTQAYTLLGAMVVTAMIGVVSLIKK